MHKSNPPAISLNLIKIAVLCGVSLQPLQPASAGWDKDIFETTSFGEEDLRQLVQKCEKRQQRLTDPTHQQKWQTKFPGTPIDNGFISAKRIKWKGRHDRLMHLLTPDVPESSTLSAQKNYLLENEFYKNKLANPQSSSPQTTSASVSSFPAEETISPEEANKRFLAKAILDMTTRLAASSITAKKQEPLTETKEEVNDAYLLSMSQATNTSVHRLKQQLDRLSNPSTETTPQAETSDASSVVTRKIVQVEIRNLEEMLPLIEEHGSHSELIKAQERLERLKRTALTVYTDEAELDQHVVPTSVPLQSSQMQQNPAVTPMNTVASTQSTSQSSPQRKWSVDKQIPHLTEILQTNILHGKPMTPTERKLGSALLELLKKAQTLGIQSFNDGADLEQKVASSSSVAASAPVQSSQMQQNPAVTPMNTVASTQSTSQSSPQRKWSVDKQIPHLTEILQTNILHGKPMTPTERKLGSALLELLKKAQTLGIQSFNDGADLEQKVASSSSVAASAPVQSIPMQQNRAATPMNTVAGQVSAHSTSQPSPQGEFSVEQHILLHWEAFKTNTWKGKYMTHMEGSENVSNLIWLERAQKLGIKSFKDRVDLEQKVKSAESVAASAPVQSIPMQQNRAATPMNTVAGQVSAHSTSQPSPQSEYDVDTQISVTAQILRTGMYNGEKITPQWRETYSNGLNELEAAQRLGIKFFNDRADLQRKIASARWGAVPAPAMSSGYGSSSTSMPSPQMGSPMLLSASFGGLPISQMRSPMLPSASFGGLPISQMRSPMLPSASWLTPISQMRSSEVPHVSFGRGLMPSSQNPQVHSFAGAKNSETEGSGTDE